VDVPVPASADVTAVSDLLEQVGADAYQDQELNGLLLDPAARLTCVTGTCACGRPCRQVLCAAVTRVLAPAGLVDDGLLGDGQASGAPSHGQASKATGRHGSRPKMPSLPETTCPETTCTHSDAGAQARIASRAGAPAGSAS
jgi:hypothetical protein